MSYVVLARKYRPQTFADIIGQDGVVETLRNALRAGHTWHASIFAGTRGTGKTSTARILAKALNCTQRVDGYEPCNTCASCTGIAGGSSVDVVEIDAASNRGIDEIRALRENVKFAPVASRYKVYIIDEAHQITEQAFNAFLKTLEEPPPHVVFILATTDFQKLPATIISRCQLFQFRPIPSTAIARRLREIVQREARGVTIDDEALQFIAESAGGAVRDALSLLDQVLAFAPQGTIDLATIRRKLGYTPDELVLEFVETVASGSLAKVLACVDDLYARGVDLVQFSRELVAFWRNMLAVSVGATDRSWYHRAAVERAAALFNQTKLIADLQILVRMADDVRRSEVPKIVFELYSVRLTKNYVELERLASLLTGSGSCPTGGGAASPEGGEPPAKTSGAGAGDRSVSRSESASEPAPSGPQSTVARVPVSSVAPPVSPARTEAGDTSTSPSRTSAAGENRPELSEDVWDRLKDALRADEPLLFSFLINATGVVHGDRLILQLPNKYMINVAKQHAREIERYVARYLKRTFRVTFELKPSGSTVVVGEAPVQEQSVPSREKILTVPLTSQPKRDPTVERIREKFKGTFVEPRSESNVSGTADSGGSPS